ncbi:AI-2E family transporter [Thermophagus xiamenensis]|uniref:Predicted PurR-regulated permease PerM n=1 Tax=Thermophagus xiamenensis TaxID=385682 RepID=A0A1I1YQV4_9BACT|nr:AI-2E family transporter [Thermophagus xiamenensis]SFE21916.1 Predicted PurR-regulated permease PerM [Thermophagus xiamenensis]
MKKGLESIRSERRYLIAQRMSYSLLAIILFIYGLIAVRDFLWPIAFGFLLSYLFFPVVDWLERHKFPRILANLIVIVTGLGILFTLGLLAFSKISSVANDLPRLAEAGMRKLADFVADISAHFGFDRQETKMLIKEQIGNMLSSGGQYFQNIFNSTASIIVSFGLLPVYIFLFLFYRSKFARFLIMNFGYENRYKVISILREISHVFVRYMAGVLMVVIILCIINSTGLWIVGLRYPIAFGIISAMFNFIPYFGTLLGGAVPLIFALIGENDPALAFRVVILFGIVQFIDNNILTPNIVGGNVRVNPFFIITGLLAAGFIWGIPGLLLIVPFLAITRIVFSHIDSMKPFAFLLGDQGTAKHSLTLDKFKKLWRKIIRK